MNQFARYMRQPREVSIETFALCNARCTFCPYPTLDRKGVKMPMGLIMRLLDEMKYFTEPFFFSPFKVNEPFLDDRLISICRQFEILCPNGRLRLFTNGSPLTLWRIDEVAKFQRVEHLWVSLNCIDAEEYQRVMGLKLDKVINNLDMLHHQKKHNLFSHRVVVSAVADDNEDINDKFRRFVRMRYPLFDAVVIKRDGWLGYVDPSNVCVPASPCARWFELSIMATGKVALCCMDGTGEFSVGDVTNSSLLAVYNSPINIARRLLKTRALEAPCQRCTY